MGTDRDVPGLKHLPRFLLCEGYVLLHVTPERGTDVHQFGAISGPLQSPVPKHIQITAHSLPDCLIVGLCGAICVPLEFPIVIPDVGSHTFPEIGVAGNGLFAQNIPQFQYLDVHRPIDAVQNSQLQSIVLARNVGGDKLYPYPQIPVQCPVTALSGTVRSVDDLLIAEQIPQLLFKEVAHRSTSFRCFFSCCGSGIWGASSSLAGWRITERFWPLMTRVSRVSL